MPFSGIVYVLSSPPPSWMPSGEKEEEPRKPKKDLPSAPNLHPILLVKDNSPRD